MAYYGKINCDLRTQLFVELILENHPNFCDGSALREALLENPKFFNVEHIVESMMSECSEGQYDFNDGIHEDFTDGSECKTGTLYVKGDTSTAEITSVRSKKGILKKGAIRCVVLNPVLEKLHFILVPQSSVVKMMTKADGSPKSNKSLWLRYNKKQNRFAIPVDKYGCIEYNTFKELAMEKNL